jgi:multidrug transporter EmrE-like cation transporter
MAAAWLGSSSPIGSALVLTATEVVGDTAAKLGETPAITYASYAALAYQLQHVLRRNSLALTNAYWNAFTNVTHTAIGVMFFGEKLTPTQYAGIGAVTLGILLLGFDSSSC